MTTFRIGFSSSPRIQYCKYDTKLQKKYVPPGFFLNTCKPIPPASPQPNLLLGNCYSSEVKGTQCFRNFSISHDLFTTTFTVQIASTRTRSKREAARRMLCKVNADGESDTQVGVLVKAPAVTVLNALPGTGSTGSARADLWQLPRITLLPLPRAELKGHQFDRGRTRLQGLIFCIAVD
jgi:hypothetical protein